MKICTYCKKELGLIEFIINNKEYRRCNKCRKRASMFYSKHRKLFPDKYKKYQHDHRIRNLDKIRQRDRIAKASHRINNVEEYKSKRIAYQEKNYHKLKTYDKNRMINRPEYFLFSSARYRSRKHNLEFTITEQDVKNIMNINLCPLRGTFFERGFNHKHYDNSMSLDRIDSTKGYIKDNIQIISHKANIVKNNIDLKLLKTIIDGLKNFQPIMHSIDNDTRKTILEDRLCQIKKFNRDKKDYQRLFNIEVTLLASAKKHNKKHNLEFNIDLEHLRSIWPLDNKCPILKEKFVFGKNVVSDLSATIDRIDNNKGYIKGNIRIISLKANSVKNNCTIEELEIILKNWKELERKRNE